MDKLIENLKELSKSLTRSDIINEFNKARMFLFSSKKQKMSQGEAIEVEIDTDGKNLILKLNEKVPDDYLLDITLLNYFYDIDEKEKCLRVNEKHIIYDFLAYAHQILNYFNIKFKYIASSDRMFLFLSMMTCYCGDLNYDDYIKNYKEIGNLVDFSEVNNETISAFLKRKLPEVKDKKQRELVSNIKEMSVPVDFSNIYDDDERANDVHCDTVADGLIMCLSNLGKVDIQYISKICNMPMKDVIMKLKGSILQNPEKWNEKFYEGWETADEYLSGNLAYKIDIVAKANKKYDNYFKDNEEALSSIVKNIDLVKDIYISLGSPWIPIDIINEFIDAVILKISHRYPLNVANKDREGKVKIRNKSACGIRYEIDNLYGFSSRQYSGKLKAGAVYKYISPLEVIENLINHKQNVVTYRDSRENKVHIDQELTIELQAKEDKLNSDFAEFVKRHSSYNKLILEYNKKFCTHKTRHYNGDFLTFPGLNTNLTLYKYQRDAIARIILSKNTLLAHQVGSGKTFIMICAGMELKRMGISKKVLYVVPNNVNAQWYEMFKYAYPSANIFYISPNDIAKKGMQNVLKDIKEKNYDAIIMSFSSFDRIEVKSLLDKKDIANSLIYFEDLGIDTLFVDEAHNYKNVPIRTNLKRALGLNILGSKKCEAMMAKVECVQKDNGGRGVIFATGTPITNSISDVFNMQCYLQKKELEILGLDNFDAWRGMFAEVQKSFEVDLNSKDYRLTNRFSKYHNIPELSNILSEIFEYHEQDSNVALPKYDGYTDESITKSKALKDYLDTLSDRMDKIRNHQVSRQADNMLKITMDGRRAALDIRIVDKEARAEHNSKIEKCIENVINIYRKTMASSSTQLIFCDQSISNDNTGRKSFSIYDELKQRLIEEGIPKNAIAFIHEGTNEKTKNELMDNFNKGIIRILIGSTFKLGIGINVQKKLIAIHHLDVPWRPADMVQREGRIIREGNENKNVFIYRYITKGTFDAYSWQILETKQKFINQIISSQVDTRDCLEINDTVLSYAEAKSLAVENPLLKEKFELTSKLDKLKILKNTFKANIDQMNIDLIAIPKNIEECKETIKKIRQDIYWRDEYYATDVEKDKMTKEDRDKVCINIYIALKENYLSKEEKLIMQYRGFELHTPTNGTDETNTVIIKGEHKYYVKLGKDITKFVNIINKNIDDLEQKLQIFIDKRNKLKEDLQYIEANHDKTFDKENEIAKLEKKLEKINAELGV